MGPLSGFVAGVVLGSSRPPAYARQVARSHRDFVLWAWDLPSVPGRRVTRYTVVVCSAADALAGSLRVLRRAASFVVGLGADAWPEVLQTPRGGVASVAELGVVWSAAAVLTRTRGWHAAWEAVSKVGTIR